MLAPDAPGAFLDSVEGVGQGPGHLGVGFLQLHVGFLHALVEALLQGLVAQLQGLGLGLGEELLGHGRGPGLDPGHVLGLGLGVPLFAAAPFELAQGGLLHAVGAGQVNRARDVLARLFQARQRHRRILC